MPLWIVEDDVIIGPYLAASTRSHHTTSYAQMRSFTTYPERHLKSEEKMQYVIFDQSKGAHCQLIESLSSGISTSR
jgi:MinD superfamily P-loop ATPase